MVICCTCELQEESKMNKIVSDRMFVLNVETLKALNSSCQTMKSKTSFA